MEPRTETEDFKFDKSASEIAKKAIEENEAKLQNKGFIEQKSEDRPEIAQISAEETKNETHEGNMLGKFKDPSELLKAYRELEKEFTRRSQRLRELEKSVLPYESEEEWKEAADKFFEKTPSARALAKDIAREIAVDPTLKEGRDCFEKALVRVLARSYRSPEQLMADGQFLENYVFNSEEVKRTIVDRYLKALEGDIPPATISGGGLQLAAPPVKPRSVKEAGSMFLRENK